MYIAIATRYRKNLINFTMAESIGSLRTNIIAIKPMNVITNWAHRRAMARRHRCDHHTFNSRSFVTGRIVILISCIQRQGSPSRRLRRVVVEPLVGLSSISSFKIFKCFVDLLHFALCNFLQFWPKVIHFVWVILRCQLSVPIADINRRYPPS